MQVSTLLSGLTAQNEIVQNIEKQLFDVVKVPLTVPKFYDNAELGILETTNFIPPSETYGTYRANGGESLGVVGKDYKATQPKAVFELLVESMTELGLDFNTLEYIEHYGGSRIRFRTKLKTISMVNLRGLSDETDIFLNFQTGFDGQTKSSLFLETYRMVCANGMKASVTEFQASFRNTKGNNGKAVSLLSDVMRVTNQANHLEEIYQKMDKFEINEQIRENYISKVSGYDLKDYSNLSPQSQRIIDSIQEQTEREIKDGGGTMFALFNGVTRYTNHDAIGSQLNNKTNQDFILFKNGKKINDRAFDLAKSLIY